MVNARTLILTAMLMVISLSTSAFAQSYNYVGTDHGGMNSDENGVKWHDPPLAYSARPRGRALYDMAQQNPRARDPNQFRSRNGRRQLRLQSDASYRLIVAVPREQSGAVGPPLFALICLSNWSLHSPLHSAQIPNNFGNAGKAARRCAPDLTGGGAAGDGAMTLA